jgi:hypothetical protein
MHALMTQRLKKLSESMEDYLTCTLLRYFSPLADDKIKLRRIPDKLPEDGPDKGGGDRHERLQEILIVREDPDERRPDQPVVAEERAGGGLRAGQGGRHQCDHGRRPQTDQESNDDDVKSFGSGQQGCECQNAGG